MTKRPNLPLLVLLVLALSSAGCALVEGVFKAGLWVGAILVLLVVAVVVWILRKMRR
jgi:uncharacterized membrane protein YkvI